jgi:hypothetical protein
LWRRLLEIGQSAVPQRRVAEDNQIEDTEVARDSKDRLGRRRDPQSADQVYRERLSVAAYQ